MIWSRQTTQASVCAILLCISRGALGHHFRIGSPRIVEGSSSTAYTFPRDKIHVFTVRQTICHSRTRRSVAEVSLLRCRGGAASFVANYFSASRTRCWAVLLIAIVTDVFTTTMMKVAQDEGSILKLAMSYAGYFISLYAFGSSLNGLDVSIAYAVWAALGTALVSTIGIVLFNESYDVVKLACLGMIVLGVVGLNLREN